LPSQTCLLPNYPNPFNPETWIPYQLAKSTDVTVQIYDIHGRLVRKLALGHQSAGRYMNRRTAAYWDGKNDTGERVSTGMYLYSLSADSYQMTRKMVIVK